MSELGQLEGLSGHLSPLAAFCQATDRALLMDVWWETRPCWVPLVDLWAAMDTTDTASQEKVRLRLAYSAINSGIFREGLYW